MSGRHATGAMAHRTGRCVDRRPERRLTGVPPRAGRDGRRRQSRDQRLADPTGSRLSSMPGAALAGDVRDRALRRAPGRSLDVVDHIVAERVGFVPAQSAPLNDLRRSRKPKRGRTAQNAGWTHKTHTGPDALIDTAAIRLRGRTLAHPAASPTWRRGIGHPAAVAGDVWSLGTDSRDRVENRPAE